MLYACNQANGRTKLSDVAEQVAAWEYGKPIDEITSTERKRVYTSIQQHHLSKLEDAGLLEVANGNIRITDKAENLDVYLEIVPEKNIPWATYYLGLAAIGAFSVGIAHVGWLPDAVSVSVVAALFASVLAVSAAIHSIESRQMTFSAADVPPEVSR
ncbi:hypothetical protein EA462_12445 [Natrarchaeobius halalkaliphilus]|uniref:DUF7344 domain-containing protein n=1 Tax=Natrarchaeobius halalkaliphilus TaxID=1679091 RepID=A0A3N6M0K7_9EURY|nr:hypothetical protein EA462_12445 [Natrarchaeobius halalkaliphilus]